MSDDTPPPSPDHIYSMPAPIDFVPQRVVSLVPSITESLFDLNLGQRLIAITDYCIHPADKVARLPKIGGTKNPDIERIIALRPDLVMMNSEENRRQDAEALQNAGIAIWSSHPQTVAEAINLLWEIMEVFDDATMVPRVRAIEQNFDIVSLAAKAETPIRTFVPIWRDPWMTFNQQTFIHDLLSSLGLENIFADRERHYPLKADLGQAEPLSADDPRIAERDTRYPRVTLDEIAAHQPQLILLPNEPYNFQETDAALFYQLRVPAAQCGNIYQVEGSWLTWHGTRLAQALQELPPMIAEARANLS